ncbi:MAG: hypothetical protein ONB44_18365 [candidate division KSB1 bacterium]|nr:hypothetical protein [candidate division KSB1 bacterium]MDZ7304094.1 hypothetical protein [candidate division KSB1 bacterium]MDZ7312074.1 hypothetical protein [candidate division KSB1 bacterium]
MLRSKKLHGLRQIQPVADIFTGRLISAIVDAVVIDAVDHFEDQVSRGSRLVRQAMEAVQERMVALPNMPISILDKGLEIVQRKDFFKLEVVKRMLKAVGNLKLACSSSTEAR